MKETTEVYQPIDANLREELLAYAANRKYVSIQYFTDIREYTSTRAVIKEIRATNEAELLILNTGEEIRLDRIIRVEGKPAPGFEDYFACAC
ncbi:hypothetical protein [Adhaeribacter radiodurans]|uniref:WYL domain-containing protein n=1 Tax=Adhaeribacter radiodurans TaxID=2745197 RepID=A0A7L7L348_9BACT|nr:hypothetical protein [Adhaeribacter radiodurans]QMU27214.1 hypothetical protein HUW48_03840 [Adhaeribacter radiodurans]